MYCCVQVALLLHLLSSLATRSPLVDSARHAAFEALVAGAARHARPRTASVRPRRRRREPASLPPTLRWIHEAQGPAGGAPRGLGAYKRVLYRRAVCKRVLCRGVAYKRVQYSRVACKRVLYRRVVYKGKLQGRGGLHLFQAQQRLLGQQRCQGAWPKGHPQLIRKWQEQRGIAWVTWGSPSPQEQGKGRRAQLE